MPPPVSDIWRLLGVPYKNIARMMVWNLAGPARGKIRQSAFFKVVESTKPELIYYREAPSPFLRILSGNYERFGTRESGIIYDKDHVWCKDITYGSKYVSRLLDQMRVVHSLQIGNEHVYKTRVALFASRNVARAQFVLLLWNGKNSETICKMYQVKELLVVAGHLSRLLLDLPVLICGNFNFDMLRFATDSKEQWTIHNYQPPEHLNDRIMHTFVTLGDIQLTNIFHGETVNTVVAEGHVTDGMMASCFDYEPVFANIVVNDRDFVSPALRPIKPHQ